MPFGLQMVGRLRGDASLLAAARALEQRFAHEPSLQRPLPDMARLAAARPELKSIVTHPPVHGGGEAGSALTAV
jgi:hypothetical protein